MKVPQSALEATQVPQSFGSPGEAVEKGDYRRAISPGLHDQLFS